MTRREELAQGLAQVRTRVERACADCGRDPAGVELIAVTKFFPVSDVDLLAELGVTSIGENRDQEAADKVAQLRDRAALSVHFIGQLQTNKAASVVRYADVIHSVDRRKLATALARAAEREGRRPGVLVQVCLDPEPGRGGAAPEEVAGLADQIAGSETLELRGVMAVAPLGADPGPAFARLREVAAAVQASHPGASWISAGMSGDLEAAIAHGATHLRVGSAILGSRPPLR